MIKNQAGFTLLEMAVVICILGLLASMAIPSFMFKIVREQFETGIKIADIVKKPIEASWQTSQNFPSDNAAAGLPAADKIVSNLVSSVAVQDGVINITFGNSAHTALKGKVVTLRPAVVMDAPIVPVTWICSQGPVPDKMTVQGIDNTTVDPANLPYYCRPSVKK